MFVQRDDLVEEIIKVFILKREQFFLKIILFCHSIVLIVFLIFPFLFVSINSNFGADALSFWIQVPIIVPIHLK